MSASNLVVKQLNQWKTVGGFLRKYSHHSASTQCEMKFSVFLPPAAVSNNTNVHKVPALYWLSGLTCNEDNFVQKANAFRAAASHGIALICPDTSPRGLNIPGDSDAWDFGVGAGFYVNATADKWKNNYRMYDYITKELIQVVEANLPVNSNRSIFGHSMGGHGALVCYLKNSSVYKSVSAFAPICNPSQCPWGIKAFTGYFGENQADWKAWDSTELIASGNTGNGSEILIDQGSADEFLTKLQLLPQNLLNVAKEKNVKVNYREHQGYDHSYYFMSTFIDDHIAHHAKYLKA